MPNQTSVLHSAVFGRRCRQCCKAVDHPPQARESDGRVPRGEHGAPRACVSGVPAQLPEDLHRVRAISETPPRPRPCLASRRAACRTSPRFPGHLTVDFSRAQAGLGERLRRAALRRPPYPRRCGDLGNTVINLLFGVVPFLQNDLNFAANGRLETARSFPLPLICRRGRPRFRGPAFPVLCVLLLCVCRPWLPSWAGVSSWLRSSSC